MDAGTKFKEEVLCRFNRLLVRMLLRSRWHVQGLLLWLLQRPYLRYVPYPYPSVKTVEQWQLQADQMAVAKSASRRHVTRALQLKAFTAKNLQELTWLRGRVGLRQAFLEDTMLTGMLAARAQRGTAAYLRKAAIAEAKAEADKLKADGKKQEALRQLVGPRGGLPTLRADLLRLAALLHVQLDE